MHMLNLLLRASSLSAVNPKVYTAGLKGDKLEGSVNLCVGETWVCEWPRVDGWLKRGGGVKDYLAQYKQFMAC